MKAKLNSEPWTRIMNAHLCSKPLLAISNRDRTKTGLGKKKNVLAGYWNTILPSHRKRKDSFVPTGKSEPDRLSQVCLSYTSLFGMWHYFLPQQTGFLQALGNRATNNFCVSHLAASTPTPRKRTEHTPIYCTIKGLGGGVCSACVTRVSRSPKSHLFQLWQPQDGVAMKGLLQKDMHSMTAFIQTPRFL